MRIAIYGKGGIGKSTITANIAAALADKGNRVLQIGCDPKQDSTRLLLKGKRILAARDYLRDQRLSEILCEGYKGVVCAEAGCPEPLSRDARPCVFTLIWFQSLLRWKRFFKNVIIF